MRLVLGFVLGAILATVIATLRDMVGRRRLDDSVTDREFQALRNETLADARRLLAPWRRPTPPS